MTTKRLEFFLTPKDENDVLQKLHAELPWIVLLADVGGARVVAEELDELIQAWIPTSPIDVSRISSAPLPPLVQFLRCGVFRSRLLPEKKELRQGRLAISYDAKDDAVNSVVRRIWAVTKSSCTSDVVRINPVDGTVYGKERNVFIGADAARWVESGGLLSGNVANMYFAPATFSNVAGK